MEKIKDGIYTYSEWVVNDINKIHELKALLVDEKNQQKRDDIYSEIEKEENTLREIIYSFPVSRVKDKCADCSLSLGETFEAQLKNNIKSSFHVHLLSHESLTERNMLLS